MLLVKTKQGYLPLENRTNFSITTEYEGEQSLSFDIQPSDSNFIYLNEESQLRFEDNDFLIKSINQRRAIATVAAEIDMDDWKQQIYHRFTRKNIRFADLLEYIIPVGWTIEGAGTVVGHVDIDIEGCSDYDILMACKQLYGMVYEYHTVSKQIKIIHPDLIQPRGLYMSDELNLQDLEFKGSSSGFVTRLYAYGKKTETKDTEGNIIEVSYVNFADINNGKEYIENHKYCEKIVSAYWHDDAITDAKELLDAAIEKLKIAAIPSRSYSCKLIDLSRINPKYRMLDFKMYDKPTLIDNRCKLYITHQIVQYKRYPDNEGLNEIALSTSFKNISGTIDGIKNSISALDVKTKQNKEISNEIIRDVASNTALIKNTYTKGETNTVITSAVQQAVDEISQSLQMIEENDKAQDIRIENTEIIMQPDNIKNIVSSEYYKKDETNQLYSTKNELSSAITQTKKDVTAILTEMSGFNFLSNSCGWSGTDFWYSDIDEHGNKQPVNTDVIGIRNNDTNDHTVSGHAFLLKKGMMKQDVRLSLGCTYTCSVKVRKYMTAGSIKIIQNNKELILFESNALYTDEAWHEYSLTFVCTASIVTVSVSSSAEWLMVSDFMLNDGTVKKTWTPNNDEIYTTGVKIDRSGIRVHQSETDTDTVIDSTEFAVEYQGKKVIRVNRDTTELENAHIRGNVQMGKLNVIASADRSRVDFFLMDE